MTKISLPCTSAKPVLIFYENIFTISSEIRLIQIQMPKL